MEMKDYRLLMEGRKELLATLDKGARHWDQMACINIITEDKNIISTNQACHAGLKFYGGEPKGIIGVVSALMKPRHDQVLEEHEALFFLDWLLNESPYSEPFITKSAEEALYYKATISSSEYPSNLMAAGMVASRSLWEFPARARHFYNLTKAGVNKDLAFYLTHFLRAAFDVKDAKVDWNQGNTGHSSMCPWTMRAKGLKNYLNHKVVHANKPYKESTMYSGYDRMWGEHKGDSVVDFVKNNFPYKAGGEVKGFFPVDEDKVKSCKYDHLIAATVEFQKEIFKFVGYEEKK